MRYAVYYLPDENSALWRFGSAVLGWDSARARPPADQERPPGLPPGFETATSEPRAYGFHATLKAPFRLRDGARESDFLTAAAALAARLAPVALGRLEFATLGGFLALRPGGEAADVGALAGRCVVDLDEWRAPLSAAERARRLKDPLPPDLLANLDRWGYPYVLGAYRFHMTLTNKAPPEQLERWRAALQPAYDRVAEDAVVNALSVCAQVAPGEPFKLIERLPLG